MPFKSEKQRRYLQIHEPEVAKEFMDKEKAKMKMPKSHYKMSKKDHEDLMNGYRKHY